MQVNFVGLKQEFINLLMSHHKLSYQNADSVADFYMDELLDSMLKAGTDFVKNLDIAAPEPKKPPVLSLDDLKNSVTQGKTDG